MKQYCESIFQTKRRKTKEIRIGNVGVGGDNPIRIQSMTTSPTRDVEATINQVMRLADSGCEIARVTVQGIKEAEACEQIKSGLVQRGYTIPLVADIHFYPPAAMRVLDFVEKVRINPGNFVDKRALFIKKEYDDASYKEELLKIEEGFSPLVEKCKRLKKALRIGTNHGSLSDRIMNRYGDTPHGMVESALEFARICRKLDFHDFLFSMKASNPSVMIQAYRLLVSEMMRLEWDYPLHLGVTEAGDGEDGRIKSAVGIGSLLLDGIGDTIRVSLTEDPWEEIDPCQRLIKVALDYEGKGIAPFIENHRNVADLSREKQKVGFPLHPDGSVAVCIKGKELLEPDFFEKIGCSKEQGLLSKGRSATDVLWIEDIAPENEPILKRLSEMNIGMISSGAKHPLVIPILAMDDISAEEDVSSHVVWINKSSPDLWDKLTHLRPKFFLFSAEKSLLHEGRRLIDHIRALEISTPILFAPSYSMPWQDVVMAASSECGALLVDGLGHGLCLRTDDPYEMRRQFTFNLLQAVRMRTTKTEFISCPGCGRTLFDLQNVTKRIREKTAHLPGVKIAIMGCIVNGPGEMADADFGYVGSKAGKIDLYVGKECVERNIDFNEADDRLIALIKSKGAWIDPSS